jgi:general stress protein 26
VRHCGRSLAPNAAALGHAGKVRQFWLNFAGASGFASRVRVGTCVAMSSGMANVKATQDKAEQNFFELLEGFDQAMLVTHGSAAGLRARPMAIAGTEEDGSIWFITGGDTGKVGELEQDSTILAVMQNGSKSMSIGGRAELSRDRAKINALWKEMFRAWFQGKDDPNIVLIRLNPTEAEYWDNSGLQGVKFVLKVAAAVVSGKSLRHDDRGEDVDAHAKVQL